MPVAYRFRGPINIENVKNTLIKNADSLKINHEEQPVYIDKEKREDYAHLIFRSDELPKPVEVEVSERGILWAGYAENVGIIDRWRNAAKKGLEFVTKITKGLDIGSKPSSYF